MFGFCQGEDDLEHNQRLSDKFFKELQAIGSTGHYFVESINRYFKFEIIYVMDMKAQWLVCGNGGSSYNVYYFCNHCPCRPTTRHFPAHVRCVYCERYHPIAEGKFCRHQPEWTEEDITRLSQVCFDSPHRLGWSVTAPRSDALVAE
jgi:hypothetical protein